jgi:hypothetical protein
MRFSRLKIGFAVTEQEEIFDRIGHQKIPNPVPVGNFIGDLLRQDLVVQGIQLDVVAFRCQGGVYALVIFDPLLKSS